MTRQEAITRLQRMDLIGSDAEELHPIADEIILLRLEALGEAEVAAAFRAAKQRCHFWYA